MDGTETGVVLIAPKGGACKYEKNKGGDAQAFRKAPIQARTLGKGLVKDLPNQEKAKHYVQGVAMPINRRIQ
jgi:hypothetical protein